MFSWIDQLASLIGYTVLFFSFIWFLGKWAQERSAAKAASADREWLQKLQLENPERYKREIWWRDNDQRFKVGLPTDPEYERQMRATVQSVRDAELL